MNFPVEIQAVARTRQDGKQTVEELRKLKISEDSLRGQVC